MRILGIDPGIAIVGYGVIDLKGNSISLVEYGCITTSSKSNLADRLFFIAEELRDIIKTFKPDEMAIEELFFNKNVKTAMMVAQARGVEVLVGKENNLDIFEYTPLQIKNALVGYGRASKEQVQEMVKMVLNLSDLPKPDDAADALAVSICHSASHRFKDQFRI